MIMFGANKDDMFEQGRFAGRACVELSQAWQHGNQVCFKISHLWHFWPCVFLCTVSRPDTHLYITYNNLHVHRVLGLQCFMKKPHRADGTGCARSCVVGT